MKPASKIALTDDESIRALKWYYKVELRPGIFTQGKRYINMLPTRKLLKRIDVNGLTALDIGSMEGYFSVLLARAGADVTAYDRLEMVNRMDLIREIYGVDFDYLYGKSFHDFAAEQRQSLKEKYDFLFFSGVLYHTIEPGLFLNDARSLLKKGGVMIFETACAVDEDAALFFNERGRFFKFTNYYQPSTQWLDYFLRILGFRIIDVEFVDPIRPDHDGKHVSRVAMTCIQTGDSVIESDDEWGAKRLSLKELKEYAPFDYGEPVDHAARVSPDEYAPDLYYDKIAEPSLRLTDVVRAKAGLKRDQSECVMRLDDRLGQDT